MRYAIVLTNMTRTHTSQLCAKYPGVTIAVDSVGHYLAICETIEAAVEIEIAVKSFNNDSEG